MATRADRIARLKAEAEAAEAAIASPEFAAAEADLREEEALLERVRVANERKRAEEIGNRLDFWRDIIGGEIAAVTIAAKPHYFIVTAAGAAAYRGWQKAIEAEAIAKARKQNGKSADDAPRAYVVAGILDWNGTPVDERCGADVDSEIGAKLNAFLREEPAIVSELHAAILRLDGAASEERKS